MRELTTIERQEVSGGPIPVIIAAVALVVTVVGAVYTAGYTSGTNQALRDNRNDGYTPAG